MKYLKTYEKQLGTSKKDVIFVDKLEKFFNEIKLPEHGVRRWHDGVQLYQGKYSKFTYENFMENDDEKAYPFLGDYISSKVPNSSNDYVELNDISLNDVNKISFSKKEYELFKDAKKYNL